MTEFSHSLALQRIWLSRFGWWPSAKPQVPAINGRAIFKGHSRLTMMAGGVEICDGAK